MENLRVRLLGTLEVDGCEPARLGRRQLRTLLKVLALNHDRHVSVDRLMDCLWGDDPPARATDQISVLVSRLRPVVGADRISRGDAGYSLAVDWLDVDALGHYAAEAHDRLEAGAIGASRAAAAAGLALVRGELLSDEVDPWWAQAERGAVDALVARLRHSAATGALRAGAWVDAAAQGAALLELDPFDESALRVVMEALAAQGRTASALARYAEYRQRLIEELGTDPAPETEALHTALLMGDLGTPELVTEPLDHFDLPGRADALAALHDAFVRAENGNGTALLLEGEAGMGKTRVLEAWTNRLASSDACLVRVAGDPLGAALPLQPLLDAVTVLVRRETGVDPDTVLGSEGAVVGPLIGFQPEGADPAYLSVLTDPQAGQSLLFGALDGIFRRLAQRQTLVLVIDDAHVADAATMRWLAQAQRRLTDCRMLMVVARRPTEAMPLPGWPVLTLGPLDLEAATRVVGPARAAALHARSGGNPLFLVELAAAADPEALPESILDAVAQRCRHTGPAAATLRVAATIGPDLDLDVLAAITGVTARELLDHLEIGLQQGFLIEDGSQLTFAHDLVREALAAPIGAARKAFIHRSTARLLMARAEADPLVVAHHARLGGETADAAAMLLVAAQTAVARFDQLGALALLNDAVSLHDSAPARLDRARVHSMMGQHQLARDDVAVAQALGAGAESLEVAAWSAHFERRFDIALELADQGARQAGTDEVRTSCLALGGWVSLAAGDLAGAEHRLESALGAVPTTSGGMAESWLAWLRHNQGRPAESLRLASQAPGTGLALYRFPNAYGLMASVTGLAMLGRAEEALAASDRLRHEVERMGATRWVPRPLNLRGWITRNLGATSEADDLNHQAMESARRLAQPEPLAHALLDLAAGRLWCRDLDAVAPLLAEATALLDVEHAFRWRHGLRGRLLAARLDLARGDHASALAVADGLAIDATRLGVPRYVVQAKLVSAIAAQRGGEAWPRETVGTLLAQLDELAGLEAWWITAEVARAYGVPQWEALAAQRTATLQAQAGDYAASLAQAAATRLG